MFDELLNMVKNNMGNQPAVASAIPPAQQDAVHHEVAAQITQGLASHAATQGGVGGLLGQLKGGLGANNPVINAIGGGVVSSLGSKFGLPPAVTGAIAASLPGLLQKFAHKADDPHDPTVTHSSITDMIAKAGGGGLGNLFHKN